MADYSTVMVEKSIQLKRNVSRRHKPCNETKGTGGVTGCGKPGKLTNVLAGRRMAAGADASAPSRAGKGTALLTEAEGYISF
jgi:hypothetical protein